MNTQKIQNIQWRNVYRSTTVCIDRYENGEFQGRLYNACLPAGQQFYGVLDFLSQMENLLNGMQFPQSFMLARNFYAGARIRPSVQKQETLRRPEALPAKSRALKTGDCGTFIVRILFRQNASWQGSVTWQEGSIQKEFRSVLELLLMMNSALRTMR